METISMDRQVEIRWQGDERTEKALLSLLGLDDISWICPGNYERWMRIPTRLIDAAQIAIESTGGVVVSKSVNKTIKAQDNFLDKKIAEWKSGKNPYLSSNEAVVVFFCTGDLPEQLENIEPYKMLRMLTPYDLAFINAFDAL